ncbi:MAG: HEAT repeat domain-containing protein [Planctomycetota bacterium]|jgi:HEAT repeat protein
MRTRLILAAVLTLMAAGPAITQDDTYDDKLRKLLQDGMDMYNRGRYDEAASRFEEAFQMDPSSPLIYAFIERADRSRVAGMMTCDDERMRDIGARLFKLAMPGRIFREDRATVLKYITELEDKRYEVWRNAYWHLKNYGAWCVRFLMPHLANELNDQLRTRVIMLLTDLGWDATLALVEALDSPNNFLRQQAAICLGNIKDDRAVPALKRVFEDPNELPEVRTLVHEAIQKITRITDSEHWKPATDYYYELAQDYYYSHASVIHIWQYYYLIWKWNKEDDRILERRVSRFAYNEQLAEEALFDLMELDPNYVHPETGESAWSLLVMVSFQESLEARAAILSAFQALVNEEISEDQFIQMVGETEGYPRNEVEPIASDLRGAQSYEERLEVLLLYLDKLAKVIRANIMARMPGKKYIYEALSRCMKDGNHEVAEACIDAISLMGRPEDLPPRLPPEAAPLAEGEEPIEEMPEEVAAPAPEDVVGFPLVEALTHEDKRVRYASAEAMIDINPQEKKLGWELVVPNLIDALGEHSVRVALVIYEVKDEEDQNFINKFRKTLLGLNIFPVVARSGSEGMIKAKAFPMEDVIIIQHKIAPQNYFRETHTRDLIEESVFDTLRKDVRTRNIPRVLLCTDDEDVMKARKEYDMTAQGYINPATHELDLKALLEKLFDTPEAQKDAKDRADVISRDAARTFSRIRVTDTVFPYLDAVEALIETVSPEVKRRDFIRIPSAVALGNFGDTRAIDVLTKTLDDKDPEAEKVEIQKPLRLACARALSEIFRVTGDTPTKEVFETLKLYTKDGDYDIEIIVGEALGNATLTNEQRFDLEKHRRVERSTYTADDE